MLLRYGATKIAKPINYLEAHDLPYSQDQARHEALDFCDVVLDRVDLLVLMHQKGQNYQVVKREGESSFRSPRD